MSVDLDVNFNVNATLDVVVDKQPPQTTAEEPRMLSFQRLHVYQRSIEFLAIAVRINEALPKGHANLADQLMRAAQSQPLNIAEGQVDEHAPTRRVSTRTLGGRRWNRPRLSTRCE